MNFFLSHLTYYDSLFSAVVATIKIYISIHSAILHKHHSLRKAGGRRNGTIESEFKILLTAMIVRAIKEYYLSCSGDFPFYNTYRIRGERQAPGKE